MKMIYENRAHIFYLKMFSDGIFWGPPWKMAYSVTSQCMYSFTHTLWNWALGALNYFCFHLKILMLSTIQVLIWQTVKKKQNINVIFLKILFFESLLTIILAKPQVRNNFFLDFAHVFFFFYEIYQRYPASVTESLRLVDERDESPLLGARGCDFILSPLRCSSRLSLAVLTTAWPLLSHTCVTWSARYESAVINLNQVCSRGRTPKTLSKVPGLKTLCLGLAFLLREVFLRPKWARHNTFYFFFSLPLYS